MMERAAYEIVYAQVQGATSGKHWLLGVSKKLNNGWTIRRRLTAATPLAEFQFFVDEPAAFKITAQVVNASVSPISFEAFRDLVLMLQAMIYATRDFHGR